MTYERREEIFSKEAISLEDMMELLGVCKTTACIKIKDIKRKVGDRLGITGKLHVQDYIDWLELEKDAHLDRYRKPMEAEPILSGNAPRIINL